MLLALCFCFVSGLAPGAPRDAQWKEVDEAQKKGLPKTAIEKLNPLIVDAMKDRAWAEAIKAIGYKGWIVLETSCPTKDTIADCKRNADFSRKLLGIQAGQA